jgi:DNA-binding NtrC family response regulator
MSAAAPERSCLLVDDDARFRDALARAIRGLRIPGGVECRQAADAPQALQALAEAEASLVFLDYRMPGLSGLDCLRQIQSRHPDLPVVMITGEGDEHVAVEAMKAGAMDYLVKGSVEPANLRRAIANALQKGDMLTTIRRQKEALMDAERQRVMIESLAAACHHLGQPATVIRGYLELVRKQNLPPDALEMVDACLAAADSMADVLDTLRKASQYRTVPYLASDPDSSRILDL